MFRGSDFRPPWRIILIATLPLWLSYLDVTVVYIGYDQIGMTLGASLDQISWISTAYMLAGIVMVPLTGWLTSRFGRKRFFLAVLAFFGVGSLLCAIATNAWVLAAFRLIQGIGGGLLGTVAASIIMDAYPTERRAEAMNLLAVTGIVGPLLGPIVGGLILAYFPWPAIFLVNMPLLAITVALALSADVDETVKNVPAPVSVSTIGLLWSGLLSLQFVLQSGERLGWLDSEAIRWSTLAAAVLLTGFFIKQLRDRQPMVNVRLFKNREFFIGNVVGVVVGGFNYGIAFLGPLFLQEILHFTPLQTALFTIPSALAMLIGNRFATVLAKKIPAFLLVAPGLLVLAIAIWMNGVYNEMADVNALTVLRLVQGFGVGLFFFPLSIYSFATIERGDIDSANGLFSLVRQVSGMACIAFIGTAITRGRSYFSEQIFARTPAWPLVPYHSAAQREQTVALISRSADVLAFQSLFYRLAWILVFVALVLLASELYARVKTGPHPKNTELQPANS